MTPEQIFLWVGAGEVMPRGDAVKARHAAEIWGRLAARLEASIATADPVAAEVWKMNTGLGVEAFRRAWTNEVTPYPGELAAYCRRAEAVCHEYADAVDATRFALTVLAVQTYVNIIYTVAYGWMTGWAGALAELAVIRDRAAIEAGVQKTLFQKIVIKLLYYLFDSVMYAGGQQAAQLATFGVADLFGDYDATTDRTFGFDPYAAGANGEQFLDGVGANAAFDGAADLTSAGLTKFGPWGRFLSAGPASGLRARAVGATSRIVGSNVYTIVNNAETGRPPSEWMPTLRQEVDKILMHVPRMAKNPTKGPIGSGNVPWAR